MTAYVLTTPATESPLTKLEVKLHLKIEQDITDEDSLLDALILTATEAAEVITRRSLLPTVWTAYFDEFPNCGEIILPYPPTSAISYIKYYDSNAAQQTLDADLYHSDIVSTPGRVLLKYNEVWPVTESYRPNAIEIRFTAGYATADAIPVGIKQAMLLMIGHWYANRSETSDKSPKEIPLGAEALLWPHRDLRWA